MMGAVMELVSKNEPPDGVIMDHMFKVEVNVGAKVSLVVDGEIWSKTVPVDGTIELALFKKPSNPSLKVLLLPKKPL